MRRKGLPFNDEPDLLSHDLKLFQKPGIMGAMQCRSQAERRQRRERRPPDRSDYDLCSGDGAAQGQGSTENVLAAWGAAYLGRRTVPSPSLETAYGFLSTSVSNNIAKHKGVIACLRHALQHWRRRMCIQGDSMLVMMQLRCLWRCLSRELQPCFDIAYSHYLRIRAFGVTNTSCSYIGGCRLQAQSFFAHRLQFRVNPHNLFQLEGRISMTTSV